MITNPQAIKFCNEQFRPMCEKVLSAYMSAALLGQLWVASGMDTLIPNDPGEVIDDGSATDGRTPITGADVNLVVATVSQLLTVFRANGDEILNRTLKASVNLR